MGVGNVKWFDAKKGYGFIQPEDGSKDIFVDLNALKRAKLPKLEEGQKVQYRIIEGRNGRKSAINVSIKSK